MVFQDTNRSFTDRKEAVEYFGDTLEASYVAKQPWIITFMGMHGPGYTR